MTGRFPCWQALDHEDRHRPEEAIQKYVDALDYFLAGYRYDANEGKPLSSSGAKYAARRNN